MKLNKSRLLLLFLFGILICGLNYGTVIANPKNTSPFIRESFTEVGYKSAMEVMEGYFNDINENRWTDVDKWFVKEEANGIKVFWMIKKTRKKS